MTKSETRRAARTMLGSLKPGAVVECRYRTDGLKTWHQITGVIWNWGVLVYRVRFPKPKRRKKK